jgi:hypothetical protein
MKDTFYKQVSHLEPHMQKLFHCCKAPWTSLELVAIQPKCLESKELSYGFRQSFKKIVC